MRAALALGLACLCLAAPAMAAQPQFWRIEGARDFLEGETDGLSVDSEGRVRLAPATKALHDPESPYVWSLARDEDGRLYLGTGNDGKVFKVQDGKGSLFFDASELEVHALAVGPDHRLYAGTSPEGKVYAIDDKGKAETFFDPSEKYIWALAFDAKGNLLVATGAEGRVHRVDRQGKSTAILASSEAHITALATDKAGNVYAGSSPGGILYRLDPSGKTFVLHDSAYREVKALDVGADGTLYAAVIDGKDRDDSARTPGTLVLPPTTNAPVGEVTVTESFTLAVPAAPTPSPSPRGLESVRPGTNKGAVLRVPTSGEVDTLWTSSEEMPHALVATPDGVLVGTGNKGKLYRVRDDRTWVMVSTFPAEQVTSLHRAAGGAIVLATSNPGRVHALEGGPAPRGTFTSKPRDTDTVSSWGRLSWEASIPAGTGIEVQTRSGNTGTPDATWSDWSGVYQKAGGDAITSERARFLQMKVALVGKAAQSPVLDTLTAAYLQRNLRPQVQSITVHPPGEIFQKPISLTGETEILGLEGPGPERPGSTAAAAARSTLPPATAYSRKMFQKGIQTFSWRADDPNGDTLVYDVYYRPAADNAFRVLRKGVPEPVLAWDTSTVPNGRYVIKVTGSDTPSNPEPLALTGDKESAPFDVDNTPPLVTPTLAQRSPLRVRVVVRDDSSHVRKAEYSVDGARWQEVHPQDGINDSREETYEFPVEGLAGPGPHVVVVRATDLLGNVATGRVDVP
jgi:sugar lactone lactonase YvrE